MKRTIKAGAFGALILTAAVASAQDIRVSVDGQPVKFSGTEPQYRNGRVLVPLRGVFEQMGAEVRWKPETRTVVATRDGKEVRLTIGESIASVDGRPVTMDVPAQVVNGSTLVPIRFLSESLGAEVGWNSAQQMVMIQTNDSGRAQTFPNRNNQGGWRNRNRDRNGDGIPDRQPNQREEMLQSDTVIPVTLDTPLSSSSSRRNDRFTATLRTNNDTYYGMLPAGTRIEGHVASARAKQGNDPGVIELAFDRIRMPNGRAYDFDGELISLDNRAVSRDESGVLRSKSSAGDNRTVFAGYGAGAGLVVGLLTKKPLEGTLIGGLLGYLAGEAQRAENKPADVTLKTGTEFGVRLTRDLAIRQ